MVLFIPDESVSEHAFRLDFSASNNEAECEALPLGLMTTKQLGVYHLQVFNDSQRVVRQVNSSYKVRDHKMA